jgi:hypothetical protein
LSYPARRFISPAIATLFLPPPTSPQAPFAKPRKASAPKKKPKGWTDDQWHQNCLRQKLSTAERKGRRAAQQEKKYVVEA